MHSHGEGLGDLLAKGRLHDKHLAVSTSKSALYGILRERATNLRPSLCVAP